MTDAFVLQTLVALRGPDSGVVEEAPGPRGALQAHLPITRAEGAYTMDRGGLGYGMPAAVCIALERPSVRVICIVGDGSSMYSNQAIRSAVRFRLPITFLALTNRCYAALEAFVPIFGFGSGDVVQGTRLPDLDFVSPARCMGCAGWLARNEQELRAALSSALSQQGPAVIDARIN